MAIVLCSLVLVPFVGREFIPLLEEGALTPQIVRLPSVSLPESIEIEKRIFIELRKTVRLLAGRRAAGASKPRAGRCASEGR